MNELRADLPWLPKHMQHLPVDHRGFPIPWFVETLADGSRDFRIADFRKRAVAVKQKLCWVCGERLGRFMAFVLGPMCAVTRTTSEPPCHLDCAIFAATACPFLIRPRMKRNTKGLEQMDAVNPAGIMIERNPGATAVWCTQSYQPFAAGDGGWLIKIGEAVEVRWYAEARLATRAEVLASIDSGYPLLLAEAEKEGADAIAELAKRRTNVEALLPP